MIPKDDRRPGNVLFYTRADGVPVVQILRSVYDETPEFFWNIARALLNAPVALYKVEPGLHYFFVKESDYDR